MDLIQLRSFLAVVRHGSFSAAARELGYTQSAVSQHLAALESGLGVALLHRRPVAPTEAGRRLADHARPILLRLGAAEADIRRLAGAAPARLSVGAAPLAGPDRVGAALVTVSRSMPRVAVALRVAGGDAVLDALVAGDLDLGVVCGVVVSSDPLRLTDLGPLVTTPLGEEPVGVAVPPGHPLAGASGLRLTDLADAWWIDAPQILTPLERLRAAHGEGYRPGLRYDGTDVATLLALVAAGGGLALLPASARAAGTGVATVPLREPRLVHRTELVHGSPTEAGTALIAALTG